jgi:peptide/nickel transport system ATP-binding protein/oligopeptide transport system ATP-binding protein
LQVSDAQMRRLRGNQMAMIFQEPMTCLNPVLSVGEQIAESVRLHKGVGAAAARAQALRALEQVEMPAARQRLEEYPHQLSGGMRQRVMIAMALITRPELLIADEPTTALDVTIQAQIIELLGDLRKQLGMAVLLITHNLGIVGDLADDVAVMYAGQIVEHGPVREVLQRPLHPYTQALIQSVPDLEAEVERLTAIPGTVPLLGAFPSGCRFHPRCPKAQASCSKQAPELASVKVGRRVRCPLWDSSVTPQPVSLPA